jgi:D-glycero-alpha-D-manno-heptose-7-phosphate kinase
MIVFTRTPVRISFLGGGTDYGEYFKTHGGGAVLATAIDKFSYIKVSSMQDFFDYRLRVSYSKTELVQSPEEVDHPSVRECLKLMQTPLPLEIHYMGDLPARTGLGSSSSFTVGLLNALHAFRGETVAPRQLAEEACDVEHNRIGERVGYQDQYMAAYGGLRRLQFLPEEQVISTPLPLAAERLQEFRSHLIVFFTGITRLAHKVLKEQIERTTARRNDAALARMHSMVDEGVNTLAGAGPVAAFGELLHESWQLKQSLSAAITSPAIGEAYEAGRAAGAIGGKLLGAGGGGFLLFFAPPQAHPAIREALKPMKELPFEFEQCGSQTIFVHE